MPSGLALFGMIAAGSLVAGSATGAIVGQYTVTGGFHPAAGWEVPHRGVDDEIAALPAAAAKEQIVPEAQFAGYYPAQASDVPQPVFADQAARDFDKLYDIPSYEEPRHDEPAFADAVHIEPAQTQDDRAYWERAAPDEDAAVDG